MKKVSSIKVEFAKAIVSKNIVCLMDMPVGYAFFGYPDSPTSERHRGVMLRTFSGVISLSNPDKTWTGQGENSTWVVEQELDLEIKAIVK